MNPPTTMHTQNENRQGAAHEGHSHRRIEDLKYKTNCIQKIKIENGLPFSPWLVYLHTGKLQKSH